MGHAKKTTLSIFVNEACNLQCRYCYAGNSRPKGKDKVIDLQFVKRAILDFFNHYPSRQIRFFSRGEATVAFHRIKEIQEWAEEITNGKATFEIQTNGFFSPAVAEWLGKKMNIIWISCDGFAEIQNFYRPSHQNKPSSSVVERNIAYLAKISSLTLGCRATIGEKNAQKQKEMIDYFDSLGVKAIMSDPVFLPVEGTLQEEKISLMDYARNYLEARKYAEEKKIFYGSIYTVNFDEPCQIFCRSCTPYPHLTTDGYISCCDMAYSAEDPKMKKLIYGRYIPEEDRIEYDQETIRYIQSRTVKNLPKCQDCEALYNCAGACLGEALNETGTIFGIKKEVCEAIRFLAKNLPRNQGLYPYLHP